MVSIITNYVRRPIVHGWELSKPQRKQFSYLNWDEIDAGRDSVEFVYYQGQLHDLGDMLVPSNTSELKGWSLYSSDTFFSGIVIKYVDDEHVIAGRFILS